MKLVLKLSALIELSAGIGLIAVPALVVRLLLGAEIFGAVFPLARVAGVALLALGVACWLVSYDDQGCAARGVVSGMVIYNLGVVLVLGTFGFQLPPVGILLWPVVILHTGMALWCITSLLRKPGQHSPT